MTYLYQGNILFVNLSNGEIKAVPTESYSDKFLGGRGINIKILYEQLTPGINALDPESVLVFGTGPLTGTPAPSCGRIHLMAKSPITGFEGESSAGGYWAPELKYSGFDHLSVKGKAEKPVYIWIRNGQVEIRDASHIWGKGNYETTVSIREELGDPEIKVISIGPAGENMVNFASVLTDLGHAAGRTGMGALMGAKNLKAIAVRGFKDIEIADIEGFMNYSLEVHKQIQKDPTRLELSKYGTSRLYDHGMINEHYYAATDNFRRFEWPEAPSMHEFFEKHLVKKVGCFGCPMRCMDFYSIPGVGKAITSCNVYYGTIWAAKIKDMRIWLELTTLCQEAGLDTQSVGNMLGWLMELYEKGIITEKDTDGIRMLWGNREAIIETTRKMALRQGLGDLLAEGIEQAAKQFGSDAENCAVHIKGLPLLSANFLSFTGAPLSTVVGPRGDPMSGDLGEIAGPETPCEGSPCAQILMEDTLAATDSMGVCQWVGPLMGLPFGMQQQARLFSLGSGIEMTPEGLMEYGCRIRNLEMAFDVREGRTKGDYKFPKRLLNTPAPDGKFKGQQLKSEKLDQLEKEYYRLRGWNVATGVPRRETLEKVGLNGIANNLEKLGNT